MTIAYNTGIQDFQMGRFSGMKISSTLGMKKFPYLKTGPFGNPIFTNYEKKGNTFIRCAKSGIHLLTDSFRLKLIVLTFSLILQRIIQKVIISMLLQTYLRLFQINLKNFLLIGSNNQFGCHIDATRWQIALNFESVVSDQLFVSILVADNRW